MTSNVKHYWIIILLIFVISCTNKNNSSDNNETTITEISSDNKLEPIAEKVDTIIIDSDMTFEEAVKNTKAPKTVIDQLVLIDVQYLSTDNRIHKGQILTNKKLEEDVRHIFKFMLDSGFVIDKAIPVVQYNWSDSLSMADNNTYSFCYRNVSYSKHAHGMAIDINPRFNPLRWKKENRPNQPEGAVLDTTINGTLHIEHIVVKEFKKMGYKWGHQFSRYYDDHHFEK